MRQVELEESSRSQWVGGSYVVHLNKRFSLPVLKVEAEGYLPQLVKPPQEDRRGFDIQLQPGAGPSGTVWFPDERPAPHVSIALIRSGGHTLVKDGRLQPLRHRELIRETDDRGHFAFTPELNIQWVVAASPKGFALVSLADFAVNSDLALQPWGRINGVLKRPSGPGANEELDLRLTALDATFGCSLDTGNHTTTDAEGRFEFELVPPGELQLNYRVKMGERKWRSVPLQPPCTINPGQTLELHIDAPKRKTEQDFFVAQPAPAQRVAPPISGVVSLPTGRPAARAEVGLVVPNEFLGLLKAALKKGRDASLKTVTDASGQFFLPGVQGVQAIVAVSEEGFAKAPIELGGKPVTLTLQPWGEIRGVLRIGDGLADNVRVKLAPEALERDHSFHYTQAFEARTDSEGRFVLTYVPPGKQCLRRIIPENDRASHTGPPTMIDVKAGGITHVMMGGTGRRVVGRVVPKTPQPTTDWREFKVTLGTFQYGPPKEMRTTPEQQQAWYKSEQGQSAVQKGRHYKVDIGPDGSFVFDEVDPEDYSLSVSRERRIPIDRGMKYISLMLGGKKVSIPAATESGDASPFDVGTIEIHLPADFPPEPDQR